MSFNSKSVFFAFKIKYRECYQSVSLMMFQRRFLKIIAATGIKQTIIPIPTAERQPFLSPAFVSIEPVSGIEVTLGDVTAGSSAIVVSYAGSGVVT